MKLRFKHPIFAPNWETMEWPFGGSSPEDDLAINLAEDWAEDEEDQEEVWNILDEIQVERVHAAMEAQS